MNAETLRTNELMFLVKPEYGKVPLKNYGAVYSLSSGDGVILGTTQKVTNYSKYRSCILLSVKSGGKHWEMPSTETRMFLEINRRSIYSIIGSNRLSSQNKVLDPGRLHNISSKVFVKHSLVEV